MIYRETTNKVRIEVEVNFVPESKRPPVNSAYFWAYRISMINDSDQAIKLISRHWIITDGNGSVELVDGEGVVGETPYLQPQERFTYASACPLDTPSGTMGGHYLFKTDEGDMWNVAIPTFSLHLPHANKKLN
jgi:ApaG protein